MSGDLVGDSPQAPIEQQKQKKATAATAATPAAKRHKTDAARAESPAASAATAGQPVVVVAEAPAVAAASSSFTSSRLPNDLVQVITELLEWKDFRTMACVCRDWRQRLARNVKARGEKITINNEEEETFLVQFLDSPLRRHYADVSIEKPLSREDSFLLRRKRLELEQLSCTIIVADEQFDPQVDPPREWPRLLRKLSVRLELHADTLEEWARAECAIASIALRLTLTSLTLRCEQHSSVRMPASTLQPLLRLDDGLTELHLHFDRSSVNAIWTAEQFVVLRQLPQLRVLSFAPEGGVCLTDQELELLTEKPIAWTHLQRLDLLSTDLSDKMCSRVARLSSLTELLCHLMVTDFSFLASLTNLQKLSLVNDQAGFTITPAQLAEGLARCPQIVSLSFDGLDFFTTDDQLQLLLGGLPKLRELTLLKGRRSVSFAFLAKLPLLAATLQSLTLRGVELVSLVELVDELKPLRQLRKLTLDLGFALSEERATLNSVFNPASESFLRESWPNLSYFSVKFQEHRSY
jgi:hypothetical protein